MVSVQEWVFNPATNQVKYPPAGGFHKLKNYWLIFVSFFENVKLYHSQFFFLHIQLFGIAVVLNFLGVCMISIQKLDSQKNLFLILTFI